MLTKIKNSYGFVKLLIVIALLVITFTFTLGIGEIRISLTDLFKILFSDLLEGDIKHLLVKEIRLPRALLGIAVGGSLSLSGVILQGIYRNPLVEPYTLGISGGASVGVALVIVFGLQLTLGSFILPVAGFSGALIIIFLVYLISIRKGSINIQQMLLGGVMISFIASSAMMFLMAITSSDNLQGIIFWIMGSLDEPDKGLIYFTLITSIVLLFVSYLFVQPLNALRLGEEKAQHLGINTNLNIRFLFILASLLAGMSVAVAGVIGFVGLIIPHIVRMIFGNDFRYLLFASFICGSIFILISDVLAKTIIRPNELPIGVITGLVGGIVFLFMMTRNNRRI